MIPYTIELRSNDGPPCKRNVHGIFNVTFCPKRLMLKADAPCKVDFRYGNCLLFPNPVYVDQGLSLNIEEIACLSFQCGMPYELEVEDVGLNQANVYLVFIGPDLDSVPNPRAVKVPRDGHILVWNGQQWVEEAIKDTHNERMAEVILPKSEDVGKYIPLPSNEHLGAKYPEPDSDEWEAWESPNWDSD